MWDVDWSVFAIGIAISLDRISVTLGPLFVSFGKDIDVTIEEE